MLGKKDKAISVIRPTVFGWDRRENLLLNYPSRLLLPVRTGNSFDDEVEIDGPYMFDHHKRLHCDLIWRLFDLIKRYLARIQLTESTLDLARSDDQRLVRFIIFNTHASKSFSAATLARSDNASAIGATASSGGLPGT